MCKRVKKCFNINYFHHIIQCFSYKINILVITSYPYSKANLTNQKLKLKFRVMVKFFMS